MVFKERVKLLRAHEENTIPLMVMTIRFEKKVRKMRGKRWHGFGAKKKNRGGGSRGGRGFSGFHKHKFSYVTSKDPDRYGYKGFAVPNKKKISAINLGDLERIAAKNEIDLNELGYQKLLSKGSVSRPLKVIVEKYTKKAGEKIRQAGGSVEGEEVSKEKAKKKSEKRGQSGKKNQAKE